MRTVFFLVVILFIQSSFTCCYTGHECWGKSWNCKDQCVSACPDNDNFQACVSFCFEKNCKASEVEALKKCLQSSDQPQMAEELKKCLQGLDQPQMVEDHNKDMNCKQQCAKTCPPTANFQACMTSCIQNCKLTPLDPKGKSISGRCRPSEQDADCEGNHPCCSCFGFCGFTDDHCTTYSWEKLGTGICPNRTSSDEEYE